MKFSYVNKRLYKVGKNSKFRNKEQIREIISLNEKDDIQSGWNIYIKWMTIGYLKLYQNIGLDNEDVW
jgi:hypothetical protein